MPIGAIKKGGGTIIGNSGEYFVVASLLKRGFIAALAPRNTPHFDILATDGNNSVNIRVKTKSAPSQVWQWMVKEEGSLYRFIGDRDFVCLVDLKDISDDPVIYIIETKKLDKILQRDFDEWVKEPGRNGRPHNKENRHRAFGTLSHHKKILEDAKNNWNLLNLESFYDRNS